jgi:hypothetical protein
VNGCVALVSGVDGAVRVSYTAPASDAGYSVAITVLLGGATTTLTSTAAVAVGPDRYCPARHPPYIGSHFSKQILPETSSSILRPSLLQSNFIA